MSLWRSVPTPALAALLVLEACGAGWHQPRHLAPEPLPPRQQVQVWREGKETRWHAVTLTDDSITGVPFLQPVSCDSCRRAFPRTAVDSIRLGNPVAGFWKTFGLVVAVPAVALGILCGTHGGCYPD
jgi:hypothetical protein